jgi:potassium efflux system protein
MQKIFKVVALIMLVIAQYGQNGFAQDVVKPKTLREQQKKSMHSRDSMLRKLNGADTSINNLLQKLQQYNTKFKRVNNNLVDGLDTAEIGQELPSILKRIDTIKSLANTHKSSTLKYLYVLRDNLDHIQKKLEGWQLDLKDISTKLIANQDDLIGFSKDSVLAKASPSDNLLKNTFFTERKTITILWLKTDHVNRDNLIKVNLLQDKVDNAWADVLDETDQIDSKTKRFLERSFVGEFGYIWEVDPAYNNFKSALKATINLNSTQLYYFLKNETLIHFIGLFFLVLIFSWIMFTRAKAKRNKEGDETIFEQANYIYKLPVISSLLVATTITPYFYDHPSTAFLEILFILSLICVLILVRKFFHKTLFNSLHLLFWLTLIYSVSNLLIEITNVDRYGVLLLSIIAIIIGLLCSKKVKQSPGEYLPNTQPAIKVFIAMQVLSLACNITGRFSLAKIIGITAVYNLWLLASLFFVVQIISQSLFLQFQTKNDEKSIISWIDYNLVQNKFRNIMSTLAALLWFFFLLQNLNIDDYVTDIVKDILHQGHSVAGASFTFGGFVIFIFIIWLSTVISRTISYFFDLSAQHAPDLSALKKKNLTSTLLVRLGVISVGFLLAVAASNFPLDKLTIIISAFGIGIGFGLQNIVNNLVSGIILAFEKPVQIGDIIEVDNRLGTIREIGVRSSRLLTNDGSEVIIPNGDLISHHVINWTLSNNNRRIELIVGTAYGSDIGKVKGLLNDLLHNREGIMTDPGPSVFLHKLNENSVDFRVFFWVDDISNTLEVKSRILTNIYAMFYKEGIEIPFPQRDVHLYLPEGQSLNFNKSIEPPEKPAKKKA